MVYAITRHHKIVMAFIALGSIVYLVLFQASIILSGPPAEPPTPEIRKLCATNSQRTSTHGVQQEEDIGFLPIIYVVTPTYPRPEMLPELTRLGQTLLLVESIHWVVAEDAHKCSPTISSFMEKLGLPFTHIASPMPDIYRTMRYVPRGVSNRRAALQWVKDNGSSNGVLYFLDDDNAIDIELFEEMRDTRKVSMWPVGLIGKLTVSSPILSDEGKVIAFYDGWPAGRKFAVDMAGFAVNVGFMKKKVKVSMPYIAGHEEDGFLQSLKISLNDIEVKADQCSKILVWHTRSEKNPLRKISVYNHRSDNIGKLLKFMRLWGVIK